MARGGQTRLVDHVLDEDVDWIRGNDAAFGTLRFAIPSGYEAYGVLDLPADIVPIEDALLSALGVDPADQLVAGWIDRGPWSTPAGDEHVLYSGWRYRLRRVAAADLSGLPTEGEGSFPDMLFPPDRSWLVSLLWDDAWRSIGSSQAIADLLASRLPNFQQLAPHANLAETGRLPT